MRLATAENLVEVGNTAGETSQFNIAMNGKMVKILSDMLYKDKIGSLVREISCNAYDSHVAAGKPEAPFYIHVPTLMEPWFSVRDEGIGMSDKTIRETFTMYGESTKDLTDDAIGAFGLGCKTPFAYRDQFTITAIYNGTKTIYSAVINGFGIPELIPQAVMPCNAHNGIEIMVSVDSKDFANFHHAVSYELKFFKVKPIVTNIKDFSFYYKEDEMVKYSDEYVTVLDNTPHGMRKVFITQGGVGYPLDRDKLDSDNIDMYEYLNSRGAILEFPIGSIDVVASRENVAYTERTCKNINDRLDIIGKEMVSTIIDELEAIDNFWNRSVEFNNKDAFIRRLVNKFSPKLMEHDSFYVDRSDKCSVSAQVIDVINQYGKMDVYLKVPFDTRANRSLHGVSLNVDNEKVFFVKDTNLRHAMRLKEFIKSSNYSKAVLITARTTDEFTDVKIAELSELFGYVKIHRISELEDNNAPVKSGGSRQRVFQGPYTSYKFNKGDSHSVSFWNTRIVEFDEDKTYHYLVTRRRQFINQKDYDAIKVLASSDNEYNIISINEAMYEKKLLKDKLPGTWIPVYEEYEKINKELEHHYKLIKTEIRWTSYLRAMPDIITRLASFGIEDKYRERTQRLVRFANAAWKRKAKYQNCGDNINSVIRNDMEMRARNELEIEMGSDGVLTKDHFEEMLEPVYADYPMLKIIPAWQWSNDENKNIIKQYISELAKVDCAD